MEQSAREEVLERVRDERERNAHDRGDHHRHPADLVEADIERREGEPAADHEDDGGHPEQEALRPLGGVRRVERVEAAEAPALENSRVVAHGRLASWPRSHSARSRSKPPLREAPRLAPWTVDEPQAEPPGSIESRHLRRSRRRLARTSLKELVALLGPRGKASLRQHFECGSCRPAYV